MVGTGALLRFNKLVLLDCLLVGFFAQVFLQVGKAGWCWISPSMNKDREALEYSLKQQGTPYKLNGRTVWERLSQKDRTLMKSLSPEAHKSASSRPAFFNMHAAEYGESAFEAAMIGSVPPIPAAATELLSYHDPGGAATATQLELLTLQMINNHESSDKFYAAEDRAQRNDRADALSHN